MTRGAWQIKSVEDIRKHLVRPADQTTVHISRSCVCDRMAIRGVPARAVDVLIDRRIIAHECDAWPLILTRSPKAGKYDHAVRDRWLVRHMQPDSAVQQALPDAELLVTVSPKVFGLRIIVDDRIVMRADYERLPQIDAEYDQVACVKRNWTRYFRHLKWETEVQPALDTFSTMLIGEGDTISELNQHVSRWLADLSYQLGWHRVIAHAARRKGLPLWTKESRESV